MTAFARAAMPALLLFAAAASAAPEPLTVEIDPPHLLVGDRVTAVLHLPLDGRVEPVTFPDWSRGWGAAEVIEAGPVTISGEGTERVAVQRLTLTAFETGRVELPVVTVRLGDGTSVSSPADLALEVRSVLAPDDVEKKPAPPAPPRPQPVARAAWIALASAVALTALAGVFAYRRRGGTDPLAAPALAPLAELERALGLLAERSPEEAFRGLSLAFRRYLGRAFGFRALESSTSEIQRRLGARGVERGLVQRSVATLRLADQVKFARRPARLEEAAQRIVETRALADEIEILLAPAEPQSVTEKTVA